MSRPGAKYIFMSTMMDEYEYIAKSWVRVHSHEYEYIFDKY